MEKKQKRSVIRNKPIPESFKGKVYLDPTYDPAFKELFDNEDALKDCHLRHLRDNRQWTFS